MKFDSVLSSELPKPNYVSQWDIEAPARRRAESFQTAKAVGKKIFNYLVAGAIMVAIGGAVYIAFPN